MPAKSRSSLLLSSMVLPALVVASTAFADGEAYKFDPMPVAFRELLELVAGAGGGGGGGQEGGLAECAQQVRTYSGSTWGPGSYVVQAGFAEGEIAAVSFVVPAGEFPLRVDLAEIIFATSNATVPTTTKWSVLFWEGTPATGNLKASFSSDGKILPHIELPPGTNGVNLNFLVDPGDPEQIYLNDNGSHIVSVGFRVDEHNNGPTNPCNLIPTGSNAFPTTDTNGLQSSSTNWISIIPCGGLCPSGWFAFNQLSAICKPTGYWNIRLTYTGLGCAPPAAGACCLPNGSCSVMFQTDCTAQGGTFQGENSSCVGQNCVPTGNVPCCFQSTGNCLTLSYGNCQAAGGVPGPVGLTCQGFTCFATGACCKPDGSCEVMSQTDCMALGGLYQGNNVSCGVVNCPQPQGASCFPNGFCLMLTEAEAQLVGATWHGLGSNCSDANENGTADACEGPACGPADFNCDGHVDGDDLGTLLGFWGNCPAPCDADLNDDGVVDGDDLGSLLGFWG